MTVDFGDLEKVYLRISLTSKKVGLESGHYQKKEHKYIISNVNKGKSES